MRVRRAFVAASAAGCVALMSQQVRAEAPAEVGVVVEARPAVVRYLERPAIEDRDWRVQPWRSERWTSRQGQRHGYDAPRYRWNPRRFSGPRSYGYPFDRAYDRSHYGYAPRRYADAWGWRRDWRPDWTSDRRGYGYRRGAYNWRY